MRGLMVGVTRNTGRTHFRKGCIPWNKGVPMSDETRAKVSASKKGAPAWNKGLKGSIKPNKGSFQVGHHSWTTGGGKFSLESRKKMSQSRLGKLNPSRGRPRPNMRGSNHFAWKGGAHSLRHQMRGQVEYKTWRTAVFTRDNWTCTFCFVKGVYLNADHIQPWAKFPDLRYVVSNGRTLCVPCHMKVTFRR